MLMGSKKFGQEFHSIMFLSVRYQISNLETTYSTKCVGHHIEHATGVLWW